MLDINKNCLGLDPKSQKSLCLNLALRFLSNQIDSPKKRRKYRNGIHTLIGLDLLSSVCEAGQEELVQFLSELTKKSQSTQSRNHVALIPDKTCDGPRHSKFDSTVCSQFSGSYGVITTHGLFILIAAIGVENPKILFLGASLYDKSSSEPEWKEGLNLLDPVITRLNEADIPKHLLTVVADHAYMNKNAKQSLSERGVYFVGKEGGNRNEWIEGIWDSLASHGQAEWAFYEEMKECYKQKTGIDKYVQLKSQSTPYKYFQGIFIKGNGQKRFIVTNRIEMTGQWAFLRYTQRWWVEVTFKQLKQLCGWRDYHPKNDSKAKKFQTHSSIVFLYFMLLHKMKHQMRGMKNFTLKELRDKLQKSYSEEEMFTVFMEQLAGGFF